MALNVTEANALNHLYHWLTGTPGVSDSRYSDEEAHEAMALLAGSAHRRLAAGVSEQQVREERERWPTLAASRR